MEHMKQPHWLGKFEYWAIRLLPVFYLVGFIGHMVPETYPMMISLTPYTILGTAVIGFLPFFAARYCRLLLWALITFLATLFLEIIGVKTGAVFGSYTYGETLGFEILEVPVLIGINWTLIILGSIVLAEKVFSRILPVMVLTALITVGFDYILEPAAIALDYWSWEGGPIPLQNYIAWGLISFVFTGVYKLMKLSHPFRLPTAIVLIQAVFFLGLRIFVA